MFKKFVSLMIAIAMLVVVCPNAMAVETDYAPSIEEILNQYHEKAFQEKMIMEKSGLTANERRGADGMQTLEQETVNELVQAGYEAYNVTDSNYREIENVLQTDLSSMGVDPNGSYIVVVSGGDTNGCENPSAEPRSSGVQPASSVGSSFQYTYGGRTYTMRYLTITAADNSRYAKASSYNIINETSPSVGAHILETLLNTVISVFLDEVNDKLMLGTIASICGLEFVDFSTSNTAFSLLTYNAGTNWTRIFTQIWSESESRWVSQLHVEYANLLSYFSGMYYSAASNRYVAVPLDTVTQMTYSDHLDNRTWRIEQAIIGYRTGVIYYDLVGSAQYMYNNSVVITHREDF